MDVFGMVALVLGGGSIAAAASISSRRAPGRVSLATNQAGRVSLPHDPREPE